MRKMEVEGEESRAGALRFEIRRQNRKVAHRVTMMITSTWRKIACYSNEYEP